MRAVSVSIVAGAEVKSMLLDLKDIYDEEQRFEQASQPERQLIPWLGALAMLGAQSKKYHINFIYINMLRR